MGLLALGTALTLAGCGLDPGSRNGGMGPSAIPSDGPSPWDSPTPSDSATPSLTESPTPSPAVSGAIWPIPAPQPGAPTLVASGPTTTSQIAWTVDDGFNTEVVAAYVEFAQQTGTALTFSPNGMYQHVWNSHAPVLRPLIEAGQVQIGNHTFHHKRLPGISAATIRAEVESNDAWIEQTFGITSRPYFRPPYGAHTAETDQVVADLGYTSILMWNGSFADSVVQSPKTIMNLARRYLQPGVIMLGHANHTPIVPLLPMIEDLIRQRGLQPVTLDTMFGTSRKTG